MVESFKEENFGICSGVVPILDGCTRCWGENILLLKVLDGVQTLLLLSFLLFIYYSYCHGSCMITQYVCIYIYIPIVCTYPRDPKW